MTIPQAFELALRRHRAGRLADAEALYRQILSAQPNHAGATHFVGLIAHQAGRHELAVEWIRRAIVLDPNNPFAHSNLGETYRAIGRLEDAVAAFRHALELKPDYPEAHNNLGMALRDLGQPDEAVAALRRALELESGHREIHVNLGNTLREQGRLDEAVAAFCRAIEIDPDHAEAHNDLGVAFSQRGETDKAIGACRRAIQIRPDYPEAHSNLGNALRQRGRLDEALDAFRRALELKADCAEIHNNLGLALRDLGRLDDAVGVYRRALELKPGFPEAHNNLGIALRERGQPDEAIAACGRALELKPDYSEAFNNLGNTLKETGRLDEAMEAFRRALHSKKERPEVHSNLVYTLHFHPGHCERMIPEERRRWNQQFGEPLKPFILPHSNARSSDRRLRVGYVSPDFRDHVVGRNLLPLFRRHDRRDFEILCYSGVVRPDELTDEFRRHAAEWRSVAGVEDEALADMIRRDEVDILVDLTQHMAGNRLPVFARKPAPVQVSFAGYPESTGLEAIEYRISDQYVEMGSGDGETERREQVRLIDSFWCYDPCGVEVEINALPAGKKGKITFGCLNNFCKVNEVALKLWARVLRTLADSRLVLLSSAGSHRQRTLDLLEKEGVEAHRVKFEQPRPRREYLELHHRLDIVLDTFPYNGHTTSLDALWMGVPVVSLAGRTPVSRAGLSQLTNLGLAELAARSETEYVNITEKLAGDLPRLTRLRLSLRDRMKNSVLMDASHFARQVEQAYRTMWRAWVMAQSATQELP